MGIFNKKEKPNNTQNNAQENTVHLDLGGESTNTSSNPQYFSGIRTEKDIIAPQSISLVDDKTLMVGDSYVRNYYMNGYPNYTCIGWLDDLYNYQGNADTMVRFTTLDSREAANQVAKEIAATESQLIIEQEKGRIRNISSLQNKRESLQRELTLIEQNVTNLLQCTILCNVTSKSREGLENECKRLEASVKGRRMEILPSTLQMLEGFNATLPTMPNLLLNKHRNFNTAAAVGCIPFYNSELSDKDGVFLGVNMDTGMPAYVKFYSDKSLTNNNISVLGKSGSGKSFFVSLLILRSSLKGFQTAIIDPEGEFDRVVNALGGVSIKVGQKTNNINIFDISEEDEVDDNGKLTGRTIVDIKEKVGDILNVLGVMVGGLGDQESAISHVLQDLYDNFGINEDPRSLYLKDEKFDDSANIFYNNGIKKTMPTLSDFYDLLVKESKSDPSLVPFIKRLSMYKKGGVYDMFDCQSNIDLNAMRQMPVISFDVSKLEFGGESLRSIGMTVATNFVWNNFVKKNPSIRKRVIVDEAWMMLKTNMAGHEHTAKFLEVLARRIRKRNGALVVSSQNFAEFINSEEGSSVVKNCPYKIFLGQDETDLEALKNMFNLTDGALQYLSTCPVGSILFKKDQQINKIYAQAFEFEKRIITGK